MNSNRLAEKILNKWPAKVICFFIAIFLYVFHQVSLVDKKTFVVPMTVKQSGMVCVNSQLPSSVAVSVKSTSENLTAVLASDIHAYLDLDSFTETGVYDIPVELMLSNKVLAFDPFEVKVIPEFFSVKIELKKAKYVKIQPSIVGEVAHGYEISSIEVNPSYAEVIGAESVIDKLEYIETSRVLVSNANRDFSSEAEYISVNKLIDVVDKGPYKVTLSVKPSEVEKVYDNVSVLPVHLKKTLTLVNEIPPVSVKLKGALLNIEKYSPAINAVSVDLRSITEPGIYDLPLIFNIPTSFIIMEKSNDAVTVQISAAESHDESSENEASSEEIEESVKADSYSDFSGGAV